MHLILIPSFLHKVLHALDLAVSMYANWDDACPVPVYTDENESTKVIRATWGLREQND